MSKGLDQQRRAVESGHWPIYRFDPERKNAGEVPFQLDCKAPSIPLDEYFYNETRYRMLRQSNPEAAAAFLKQAQANVHERRKSYERMASPPVEASGGTTAPPAGPRRPTLPPSGPKRPPQG